MQDDDMPKFDVKVLKALGELMSEDTGYPCISIYEDFAYEKKTTIKGTCWTGSTPRSAPTHT